MPWCESELNHCPSKFHFWIQKLLFFSLRSRKHKREAHDDCSQFELSTWSSSGEEKSIPIWNMATSNISSLTSRGHWSLDHVSSQRIIHRLINFVALALVLVFWHFRWIQKWLQGIQGPCGSFRKFSIKINFTLKPPRSPCLDSDRMHACTRFATRQNPWLRSRISLLDKWAACLLRTALISILRILKIAFHRGLAYTRA